MQAPRPLRLHRASRREKDPIGCQCRQPRRRVAASLAARPDCEPEVGRRHSIGRRYVGHPASVRRRVGKWAGSRSFMRSFSTRIRLALCQKATSRKPIAPGTTTSSIVSPYPTVAPHRTARRRSGGRSPGPGDVYRDSVPLRSQHPAGAGSARRKPELLSRPTSKTGALLEMPSGVCHARRGGAQGHQA